MIGKLENPKRIAELNPSQTLRNIGIRETDTFSDIGAGTGIFTFAAAHLCKIVYALEKSTELIDYLDKKAQGGSVSNLRVIHVNDHSFGLPDQSCDVALMCTVLHEIDDKLLFLKNTANVLKQKGKLAVIEFHKKDTPMGPPVHHRISEDDAISLAKQVGFSLREGTVLGSNFYLLIFEI